MGTVVATDTQIMRGINARAILRAVRSRESASVTDLAHSLGLSRQAVARSLTSLEASGLISISAPDSSTARAGRPPQLARFCSTAGYILAASLAPGRMRTAIADLRGEIVAQREVDIQFGAGFGAEVAETAVTQVHEAGIDLDSLWVTVLAIPGIVDPSTGKVRLSASMPYTQSADLSELLTRRLCADVLMDNEVKLATQGERWRGTSRNVSFMVLIEWGERIGAGLVLNGSLYRGGSNDSGDLGFLDLADGPGTGSDNPMGLGPFEAAVGGAAVIEQARRVADSSGDRDLVDELQTLAPIEALDLVIDRCLSSSSFARSTLQPVTKTFARGVAALRALVDPEVVVIGGQMARCGQILISLLNEALEGQPLNQPRLELSRLGRDAAMYGAIYQGLQHVDGTRLAHSALTRPKPTTEAPAYEELATS